MADDGAATWLRALSHGLQVQPVDTLFHHAAFLHLLHQQRETTLLKLPSAHLLPFLTEPPLFESGRQIWSRFIGARPDEMASLEALLAAPPPASWGGVEALLGSGELLPRLHFDNGRYLDAAATFRAREPARPARAAAPRRRTRRSACRRASSPRARARAARRSPRRAGGAQPREHGGAPARARGAHLAHLDGSPPPRPRAARRRRASAPTLCALEENCSARSCSCASPPSSARSRPTPARSARSSPTRSTRAPPTSPPPSATSTLRSAAGCWSSTPFKGAWARLWWPLLAILDFAQPYREYPQCITLALQHVLGQPPEVWEPPPAGAAGGAGAAAARPWGELMRDVADLRKAFVSEYAFQPDAIVACLEAQQLSMPRPEGGAVVRALASARAAVARPVVPWATLYQCYGSPERCGPLMKRLWAGERASPARRASRSSTSPPASPPSSPSGSRRREAMAARSAAAAAAAAPDRRGQLAAFASTVRRLGVGADVERMIADLDGMTALTLGDNPLLVQHADLVRRQLRRVLQDLAAIGHM